MAAENRESAQRLLVIRGPHSPAHEETAGDEQLARLLKERSVAAWENFVRAALRPSLSIRPWALAVPETSTMSPGSNISQPTFLPTSHSPMSSDAHFEQLAELAELAHTRKLRPEQIPPQKSTHIGPQGPGYALGPAISDK